MKEANFQRVTLSLIAIQILITFWGIWYITTMSDRKISEDCSGFIDSWIESNPQLPSDTLLKLSNDCYRQGGSREWQLSQYIKETHDDISTFISK